MHPTEIELLNRYAAAELAGSMLLGKYARTETDPFLIARLVNHCADEARHAWKWVEFMEKKQIPIVSTHGRNDYFSYMSEAKGLIDFLAAVHVYETRVPFHLTCHSQMSMVNPELRALMLEIMDDEQYHLAWIREYFQKLQSEGNTEIGPAIEKAGALEHTTYTAYINFLKQQDEYSQELAHIVEKKLPEFTEGWKHFLN